MDVGLPTAEGRSPEPDAVSVFLLASRSENEATPNRKIVTAAASPRETRSKSIHALSPTL